MRQAIVVFFLAAFAVGAIAQAPPASQPTTGAGKLPHIQVDVKNKQVRVECISAHAEYGLEYFCCALNTCEYESIIATAAKASQIHLALLMIGLQPGEAAKYDMATQKWSPPHGPPLDLSIEYQKDNATVSIPSFRLVRNVKTKKEADPFTWIFAGSRVMSDGNYAADGSGAIVSMLTSDLAVISLSELASTALEDRAWESNPQTVPPVGTRVWLVIEPAKQPKK